MKKQKDLLDRVSVEKPCTMDWDKMFGNEEVRFCEHCAKSVHNLSMMTRKDAERLVKKSNGNLCIRYYTDKNKKIALRDAPVQITRLGRRVSQFAASVFTAALSVSAVAAQGSARIAPETPTETAQKMQTDKVKTSKSGASSIKGTVFDPNEAVVPGAAVDLLDSAENVIYQTETNEEGVYEINYVQAGNYRLRVQSPGFQIHFTEINLQEADDRTMDATLDVTGAVAGGMMIGESQISKWVRHTDKRNNVESAEDGEKLTEFFNAVESDELADVKQMLRGGFPINTKNSLGETALMRVEGAETAKYLLRRKADVNAANSYNETALMLKATDEEIVKVLLDAKADVNATSSFGDTALMYAMQGDEAEPVELLLKAGADVNASDIDGRTALMFGVYAGEIEIIKLLVESNANVNARDAKGKTVLMYAVEGYPGDEAENIKYLIENGADVNARDSEGKSILKLALEEENEETIKLLKSYGAIE
ncbi:MAG TPA: ankyrin repeat domain-containing protein [Pyrinomonadaceae bacterium]|jgi:ankyrin repeat protein